MDCRTVAFRGLLLLVLVSSLLLSPALVCVAQDETQPTVAPVNPAFEARSQVRTQSLVDGRPGGLVPEPIDTTGINQPSHQISSLTVLPSSYDLRTTGKLTAIRDQGGCGSCWAFATMGSLESTLMPGEVTDFSENNLKNLSGFSIGACNGGNRGMSAAYLLRWGGPVAEGDDPYNASGSVSPADRIARKHVQEIIYLPNRSSSLDNDAIKQAVMTYGAVYTTYYHSGTYYKSATSAYYFNGTSQANHAVCIVGWDDNYSASNFNTTAPGNGAFLIRNSWGTYWGLSGYQWISYYDTVLGTSENAVFRAESNTNYDHIYQYDPLGWISNTGYSSNTAWLANVFTTTTAQSVAAAGWYCPAPNSSYTLYVYTGVTNSPIGTSGALATVSGTITTAGYHTVQLPSSVPVQAGQKFSVVVKLTTPGYNYPVCLEAQYTGFTDTATSAAGQSYMSSNGTSWTDVANYWTNANVCLKAYTLDSGTPAPAPGTLSVASTTGLISSGKAGGPFTPASATFTLTNAGDSSINWTATPSATWIGVSSTGGTLAGGAQVTVTVSISANANTLIAGSYAGSVAFANTTNGYGNASRGVALTVSAAQTPGALSVVQTTGLVSAGVAGGIFSPSSATYTVTNTGQTSINWSLQKAQPWLTLSTQGGTLAGGASTTVTVSINTTASTLSAGSYSDSVGFTNTTNGTGNTTRGVSLTVTPVDPAVSGIYNVAPTAYSWIDITKNTPVSLRDDATSSALSLPFTFIFYGKAYTKLYVGSNGMLGFGTLGMTSYANSDLPYAGTPNAAIYPCWDDLNPAVAGYIRIATLGTAPNRTVVVSWVGVPLHYSTATRLTFEAILCEGSNDIVFQYQNVGTGIYSAGASATVGIENASGNSACKWSYNTKSLANGLAIRFSNQTVGKKATMTAF